MCVISIDDRGCTRERIARILAESLAKPPGTMVLLLRAVAWGMVNWLHMLPHRGDALIREGH